MTRKGWSVMTEDVIAKAAARGKALGINHLVVASSTGETAGKAVGALPHVVWVTYVFGYRKSNEFSHDSETYEKLKQKGLDILTATHVLSGAERGLSARFKGYGPVEVLAETLRMFGMGTKVAVEVAVMALDAGLVPEGEKIIAIGGTGRGADTALVITPGHAAKILETKIHEIIIKPDFY